MKAHPPLYTLSTSSVFNKIKRNLASPKHCRDIDETSISNQLAMLSRMEAELPLSMVMTRARARLSSLCEMEVERSMI